MTTLAASGSQHRSFADRYRGSIDLRCTGHAEEPSSSGNLQNLQLLVPQGIESSGSASSGHIKCSVLRSFLANAQEQMRMAAERCKVVLPAFKWIHSLPKALYSQTACACFPIHHRFGSKARIARSLLDGATPPLKEQDEIQAEDFDRKPLKGSWDLDETDSNSSKKCRKGDQSVLLRIAVVGSPKTLLLLAPADATAETVIEMILRTYAWDARPAASDLSACTHFDLYCAHCNSPALHPKQPIGTVGSRYFLLCRRPPAYATPRKHERVIRMPHHRAMRWWKAPKCFTFDH